MSFGRNKVEKIKIQNQIAQGLVAGEPKAMIPISIRDAIDEYFYDDAKVARWSERTRDDAVSLLYRFLCFCHHPPSPKDHSWMRERKHRQLATAKNMGDLRLEYFAQFMDGTRAAKISRRHYSLRLITFLNWAASKLYIQFSVAEKIIEGIFIHPKEAVRSVPQFTVLTKEQVERMWYEHERRLEIGTVDAWCDYIATLLFYKMLLRAGDVSNLRIMDVNLQSRTLFLAARKGEKQQVLRFGEGIAVDLEHYLEIRRSIPGASAEPSDPLLIVYSRKRGKKTCWNPVSTNLLYERTERLFMRCGFKRPGKNGPHILRHSGATHLLQDGKITLKELQMIMGHESVETTMIYWHLAKDETKNVLDHRPIIRKVLPNRTYGRNYVPPPPPPRRFRPKAQPVEPTVRVDDDESLLTGFGG